MVINKFLVLFSDTFSNSRDLKNDAPCTTRMSQTGPNPFSIAHITRLTILLCTKRRGVVKYAMSNLEGGKCTDNVEHADERRNPSVLPKTDSEWIALANKRYQEDKLFDAYRMLKNVQDKTLFSEEEIKICSVAVECESAIADLLEEPDMRHGWTKQGECHGEYDTTIFYKVDPATAHLTCRLETPIEFSLLIPLLSVLNESNLYTDWCPSWTRPIAMGITTSEQIQRIGRVNQMIHVVGKVPWPFYPREVFLETIAIDDIDENSYFAVRLYSKTPGGIVPELEPSVERVDFQGVLLFRPCPIDRMMMRKEGNVNKSDERKSMILVSFKM